MILGVISDVHANILALEAVVTVLREKGADTIICLGDVVGYGPSPNETIDLLRQEGVMCTLGAADEQIAFEFAKPQKQRAGVADEILEWTRTVIEPRHVDFLRNLPLQLRLNTPVGRLRFFHSTLHKPGERLDLNQDVIGLTKLLEEYRCTILATGKTHVPFLQKTADGLDYQPRLGRFVA